MSVLDKIFATKREEVAQAKSLVSEASLLGEARGTPLGFRSALQNSSHPVALIAEVKKASPSQGLIRGDFDPVAIAEAYVTAGADALSVLTDEPYFQGSPEFLRMVRQAVKLPILRKDFLYDPYQVLEARAWGADAILVIVAGITVAQAHELMSAAEELGMDSLVEVHTREELDIALSLNANLIGVNNRDLSTFETDLGVSEALLPHLGESIVGISESALATSQDIQRVANAGARAVLIGTTFCGTPDIEGKVGEVMGW